tara:strand:+ start:88 stop:1347 length:1260 start_codon:yes stop_codon:yes gene_type:complete
MIISKTKTLLKNLGPGLLFACMAIGTSHLVLSTKAGAQYGFIMIIPILLANIFKYPFFEFGIRYTSITSKTLIEGYLNRGRVYLWFYTIITLITTFTILAVLYTVTAGLFINLFQIVEFSIIKISFVLFILISSILILGKYKFLELSLKLIVTILFFALIITTALVIINGKAIHTDDFVAPVIFNETGILFLIGLMGWMPTTVEASSWVSLWSIEKFKITANKPSLQEAILEFKVGYFLTALFAVLFLIIGSMTLYGTNTTLSDSSIVFADQLVNLFTTNIGSWSYLLIAVAAFSTMLSTCITAHDALARVSIDIIYLLPSKKKKIRKKHFYTYAIIILSIINFIIISVFSANMGQLIAIATFVSFIVAPVVGYMNYKNVMSNEIPLKDRPKKGLQFLTYLGIIFLSLFSVYYFWIVLF